MTGRLAAAWRWAVDLDDRVLGVTVAPPTPAAPNEPPPVHLAADVVSLPKPELSPVVPVPPKPPARKGAAMPSTNPRRRATGAIRAVPDIEEAVTSMEMQLVALYEEKSELQTALGVSTSEEIIALVRQGPAGGDAAVMNESLTLQLEALYAERTELYDALGITTSQEVVELVCALRASVRQLVDDQRRLLSNQSQLLEIHERNL